MKDKIISYFDSHRDDLREDIFKVCRINSERTAPVDGAPFGEGPRAALELGCELARYYGFEANILGDRVMVAEYGEGEPKLAILAHLDVVPAGTGWTKCEPYEPVDIDGVLYGRGVADDKGPAIAGLYALRCVKELGVELGGKVQLILGSSEETGSEDVRWYCQNYKMPPMVFTPDGDYPVVNTEKGHARIDVTCADCGEAQGAMVVSVKGGTVANAVPGTAEAVVRFVSDESMTAAVAFCAYGGVSFEVEKLNALESKITCYGEAAHASLPEDGENAVCALLGLLTKLPLADCAGHDALCALNDAIPYGDYYGEAFGAAQSDESGPLTVNLGLIDYSLESGLKATIDMRIPVCGDGHKICSQLQEALGDKAKANMPFASKPHCVPADSEFVTGLLGIYEEYTGLSGEPIAIGGGTYVHNIEGGVAFGCTFPGRKPKMHEPDETIPLDDLVVSGEMFAAAICQFCK